MGAAAAPAAETATEAAPEAEDQEGDAAGVEGGEGVSVCLTPAEDGSVTVQLTVGR